MTPARVGAITIGQAPRPDLLEPLLARLGADADVIEAGALDGMTAHEIRALSADATAAGRPYPLTTRLLDGSRATLDESELEPLVQQAIAHAEDAGASVTLLLCAGGFADAAAHGALVRPFDAAVARLHALGVHRISVVVPYEGQVAPSRRKWDAAGFEASVLVGDPATVEPGAGAAPPDAIVLDYVGHPSAAIDALRRRTTIPVVDLGEAGADAVVALVDTRPAVGPATVAVAGR